MKCILRWWPPPKSIAPGVNAISDDMILLADDHEVPTIEQQSIHLKGAIQEESRPSSAYTAFSRMENRESVALFVPESSPVRGRR
jgi:hypothetical protein